MDNIQAKRIVTEKDFRQHEFRDANPEDYEFRADGKVVRKDRWEIAFRNIVYIVGYSRHDFEIEDVVETVRQLVSAKENN